MQPLENTRERETAKRLVHKFINGLFSKGGTGYKMACKFETSGELIF